MSYLYNRLLVRIYRIDSSPLFSSFRRGFLLMIPVILTGCIALLINSFPVPAYRGWLTTFAGGLLSRILVFIYDSTVGFMSAYLTLSISYYYSENFTRDNPSLQILCMANAFACFAASFGAASGSLTLASFGTTGLFTAMLCATLSTRLFFFIHARTGKHFNSNVMGADIHYRSSMTAVVPLLGSVLTFVLINVLLTHVLRVDNVNDLIANGLVALFSGVESELANSALFIFMINFLWVLGIHGGNALDPVAHMLYRVDQSSMSIVSKSFLDNFALMGGSGATVCLVLALLIASRSRGDRQLAKSALPLTIFNINELLVFGLPIVFNPVMVLPFILTPLCALFIAYGAVNLGIMPVVSVDVPWTTPPFISGYLATNSIRGALVQLVIIAAGTAIYLPFVGFLEKLRDKQAALMLEELTREFVADQKEGLIKPYLTSHSSVSTTAKAMVNQLNLDIEKNNIVMYYQPQFSESEEIVGAEALLRWKFSGQRVYPPLVVALAQEDRCYERLTWSIIGAVLNDANRLLAEVDKNLQLSINITAQQLNNREFVEQVVRFIKGKNIGLDLVLEVTEESSLIDLQNIPEHINMLNENGISMAIDDFSMGQTSLNYLHSNKFQYVKLDGELVKQVVDNGRCRDIISSIVSLGQTLDFEVVAEYVENRQIRDILIDLGCQTFQGYLYSPALSVDDFIQYAKKHRANRAAN